MISRIWKEEKNTVIGLFISVLAGMLLITTCLLYTSNISLWYSINGGGLMEMERGQVLQTDRTDMVSFYVKPATGYVTPTTFEHRNGRSEACLLYTSPLQRKHRYRYCSRIRW